VGDGDRGRLVEEGVSGPSARRFVRSARPHGWEDWLVPRMARSAAG
jgi:hypothetical protein